jgi:hypothetical protein
MMFEIAVAVAKAKGGDQGHAGCIMTADAFPIVTNTN